ncbi:Rieske 2Fe-2S domain-containing protein [Brasilonema bromeliae]|uniref:Aromatic ring-hydroxylating dioxygenase subunit alpha n=1 Tax=Brasilonema bromeliae SPC951 TaxID=385972 RepID=A0ABX1P2F6_9CYAN|nr:Rieske 2Fe-2S domain-containing protein [Brasilonema bromeliae]NMG18477.1 aromatic ring-hydroxylating dioxygenase subunit alpha [Brasilonema bromeliae SPC951]
MSTKLETVKNLTLTQPEREVNKRAMNLPASWYVAMPSKALGKKPKEIELFGQPLVAWRDQNGHPAIMQRYCSHKGTSLAIGKVVDGCIQCPFHHWRFDSSGQCVFIPEVDKIPPKARQANYVTAERYGYIWVWYGSETPMFPLPEFPAAEDDRHNYMPFRFADLTKTTVRHVIENGFDQYHIITVHDLKISEPIKFTLLTDQYTAEVSEPPIPKEARFAAKVEFPIHDLDPVARTLGFNAENFTVLLDSWPAGQRVTAFVDGKEVYKLVVGMTPIAEKKSIQHILVMVKKTGKFWLDIFHYVVFSLQNKLGVKEDMPIYDNTNQNFGVADVKHDLGVLKFREFYQRWIDKVE